MTKEKIEHFEVDLSDPDFSLTPRVDLDDFATKSQILKSQYKEISPTDFYRYLFPSGSFERLGHQEDKKGNGIAISIDEASKKATKKIVTDGLEQLSELLEENFVVLSPISYFGCSRKASNALWMHALTLDIDYVSTGHLKNMLRWFENPSLNLMPRPTFIVNSGHGVHLYYVFDQPIAMYKRNQKELLKLKKCLVDRIWTDYTSTKPERKEALGITQGFRMVGSFTKMHLYRLAAYQTGGRVTIDYLNEYAYDGNDAVINQPSLFSLEQSKEEWPEWYESRIVRGEAPGRWHVKRDLYDWWKRQISEKTTIGHRYFCMMCLAVYARKCDIEEDELRSDAAKFQEQFNEMGNDTKEPFTWEETEKALEAYNESYVTFPRETIERISGVAMPANKRNGRTRLEHVTRLNRIFDLEKELGEKEKRGRPKGSIKFETLKGSQIKEYKLAHPELSNRQIATELGVSRNTVNKWLKM